MIKLEKTEVMGWEHAIRGMRNPMNSWEKSDSLECIYNCDDCDNFSICKNNDGEYFKDFWENGCKGKDFAIGPNDHNLMMGLAHGGPVHAKYRRMITVYVDITAPLYWWKEFDTYKVGTVANSCSTMHKIHAKEFTLEDFSCEHLIVDRPVPCKTFSPLQALGVQIEILNKYREMFIEAGGLKGEVAAKEYWWQMIQLLPSSYNQKRTVMLNYEVLTGIYPMRKNHKLDEWHVFCDWIESLPYSEIIIGEKENA